MLVLGRKPGQAIVLDGPAEVRYLPHGLAIIAPQSTRIIRKEVAERDAASQDGDTDGATD